jgi:DnaK suppressor protein
MDKDQATPFESKLREKRQELARSNSCASGINDLSADYGRDEGDRAKASEVKEIAWLQTSRQSGLGELVDAALRRIQDGTFGECLHCGQEISPKRLAAIPWTRYCITCQELLEQYGS